MDNVPTSVEAVASTVEEAIEKGLEQLGVGPSQVIVEVIEEPSRGLFGLGSKQARVRLQLLAPPPPRKTAPTPPPQPEPTPEIEAAEPEADFSDEEDDVDDIEVEEPVPDTEERSVYDVSSADDDDFFDDDGSYEDFEPISKKRTKPAQRKPSSRQEERPKQDKPDSKDEYRPPSERERTRDLKETSVVETPPIAFMDDATDVDIAQQVIDEINDIMQLNAHLDVFRAPESDRDREDGPPWVLNLEGDNERLNDLIGKRGETLTALQYITRLIVSKQIEARANIIVDVNNHRNSRSEKLEKLAHRMADQAVETNRTVTLEPMPPHERRIIHMVLRAREDVETESEGQGDARRVMIMPKTDPIS